MMIHVSCCPLHNQRNKTESSFFILLLLLKENKKTNQRKKKESQKNGRWGGTNFIGCIQMSKGGNELNLSGIDHSNKNLRRFLQHLESVIKIITSQSSYNPPSDINMFRRLNIDITFNIFVNLNQISIDKNLSHIFPTIFISFLLNNL